MQTSQMKLPVGGAEMSTELLVPDGKGPFGAVIVFVDGGGMRKAMNEIGERIAGLGNGYLVAIPDLFFRSGSPFDLLPPGTPRDGAHFEAIFGDAEKRAQFFSRYYSPAIEYPHLKEDVAAVLSMLQQRPDFNGKVGTTGYCMGGNSSLRVAALFGDQIAAAASFHGGGIATDQPDSPHLRAKEMKARISVAGAIEDGSFNDAAKEKLIAAFAKEHVDAQVETYPGHHGFAVSDNGTYDAACAKKHDEALASLYGATLKVS